MDEGDGSGFVLHGAGYAGSEAAAAESAAAPLPRAAAAEATAPPVPAARAPMAPPPPAVDFEPWALPAPGSAKKAKGGAHTSSVPAAAFEKWALERIGRQVPPLPKPAKGAAAPSPLGRFGEAAAVADAAKLLALLVERLSPTAVHVWAPPAPAPAPWSERPPRRAPRGSTARLRVRLRLNPALLVSGAMELSVKHSGSVDALARIASTDSFVGAHWRVRGEGGEGDAGEVVELALLSTAEADGGACVDLLRGELHLLSIPEEGQFGWEK